MRNRSIGINILTNDAKMSCYSLLCLAHLLQFVHLMRNDPIRSPNANEEVKHVELWFLPFLFSMKMLARSFYSLTLREAVTRSEAWANRSHCCKRNTMMSLQSWTSALLSLSLSLWRANSVRNRIVMRSHSFHQGPIIHYRVIRFELSCVCTRVDLIDTLIIARAYIMRTHQ